ncbi:MAG: hypothetical protein JKY52_09480 [Flavobacteriales bacterium]|nr:hypothetical protein [Flavobacteriales bacterium]
MEYISLKESAKLTRRSTKTIQRHLDKLSEDEKGDVSKYGNSPDGSRIRLVRKEWLYKYWKVKDSKGTAKGQHKDTSGQLTDTKGQEEETGQAGNQILKIKDDIINELRNDKKRLQNSVDTLQNTVDTLVTSEGQTKTLLADLQLNQGKKLEAKSTEEKTSNGWIWVGVVFFALLFSALGYAMYSISSWF